MSFVVAPAALVEIKAIAAYIRRDNPPAARRFRQELFDKFTLIGKRPKAFRLRSELGPDIRVARQGAYLILYRVTDEGARIVRVLHGARDLAKALKNDPA